MGAVNKWPWSETRLWRCQAVGSNSSAPEDLRLIEGLTQVKSVVAQIHYIGVVGNFGERCQPCDIILVI
ncbi:hypothetical protein TNCV_4254571 [Trichonephila clavipes]|nr:hypothetical protein TNCV_4254571 [Trichonephila clavipes]